jgi:hypothetical protein
MRRIPVHIVTGLPRTGKTALIARFCEERPDWLGLVNALPADVSPNLRLFAAGCPCCTGRVVLEITLARALRETRAVRVFVELPDPAHGAGLGQVLAGAPLNRSVSGGRALVLPRDLSLQAAGVEG